MRMLNIMLLWKLTKMTDWYALNKGGGVVYLGLIINLFVLKKTKQTLTRIELSLIMDVRKK